LRASVERLGSVSGAKRPPATTMRCRIGVNTRVLATTLKTGESVLMPDTKRSLYLILAAARSKSTARRSAMAFDPRRVKLKITALQEFELFRADLSQTCVNDKQHRARMKEKGTSARYTTRVPIQLTNIRKRS
jgi:hypothetical protein